MVHDKPSALRNFIPDTTDLTQSSLVLFVIVSFGILAVALTVSKLKKRRSRA